MSHNKKAPPLPGSSRILSQLGSGFSALGKIGFEEEDVQEAHDFDDINPNDFDLGRGNHANSTPIDIET